MTENGLPAKGGLKLSSDAIKYLVTLAMLIDHIAWCFVDTYSALGQIMHILGRITAPVMCYFIAEGYYYTRSVIKYLLRLGIFALISWAPFVYMEYGQLPVGIFPGQEPFILEQSVIFTFFLGLCALIVIHSELEQPVKLFLLIIIYVLSLFGDWMFLAVTWIILFDKYRGDLKKQLIAFAVSEIIMETLLFSVFGSLKENLFQYGALLAVIPLLLYGEKKGRSGKFHKWFFYIFYPSHMLILGLIKFAF